MKQRKNRAVRRIISGDPCRKKCPANMPAEKVGLLVLSQCKVGRDGILWENVTIR